MNETSYYGPNNHILIGYGDEVKSGNQRCPDYKCEWFKMIEIYNA